MISTELSPPQSLEGWSNARGEVLTTLVEGQIWAAERAFMWNGIDVGGRCTILRLADGSLFVYSPVALDAALADALATIGEVRHVLAPNFEHVKYARQWANAYPSATLYGCPGLTAKFPAVPVAKEVGVGNPDSFLDEFAVTFLDFERNPFTQKPFFNEVVVVHRRTGTLMAADFFWNYPSSGMPLGTRAWKFGMDRVYLPFYKNLMVIDRDGYEVACRRLLHEIEWDALVPCHGRFLPAGGKQALQKHLSIHDGSENHS